VRQAIGYGIDREEIIKYQKNSIGKPASKGFVPDGMPGFDHYRIDGFNFDFERAQQLLVEAGYPNGEGAPEITLVATVEFQSLCQYLQKALGNLGLKVNVDIHTASSMTQRIALFDVNFYRKSWVADYPDAINYFQLFYSSNFYPENGSNYTHFDSPEYDLLYEAALFENNDRTRYELYKEMQLLIQEEVPVIPLFYAETFRCVNNKVEGLEGNSLNMLSLKRVKVEKK
ncbi:MAG: ABC transporter substrate-binding protein, partial [Flavobacteriales bacterium]|nr:ABC transporter substrate-binding protein [Flavobacteriales bacterium]